MQEESSSFDWGETVRVKSTAPIIFRPGEVDSVCGITRTESETFAKKHHSNIGEWVYTIEYLGGSDIEILERYLEKYV